MPRGTYYAGGSFKDPVRRNYYYRNVLIGKDDFQSLVFLVSLSPIKWSVCISVDRSVGRSVGRLVGQSVGQTVGQTVSRSVGRSVSRLIVNYRPQHHWNGLVHGPVDLKVGPRCVLASRRIDSIYNTPVRRWGPFELWADSEIGISVHIRVEDWTACNIIITSYQKLPFGSGDYPEKLLYHQALN